MLTPGPDKPGNRLSEHAGASFDVFDTLITRIYATPEDVHGHVGERLSLLGLVPDAAAFTAARLQAEATAWTNRGGRCGASLDEIYRVLGMQFCWNQSQTQLALAEEVDAERFSVRAIPDNVHALNASRESYGKVCFISDMHLGSGHIRAMLSQLELVQPEEKIFVSSDLRAVKSTGELFRKALREMSLSPKRLHHLGDSQQSDIRGARRCGIQASWYRRAHLNRFEQSTLQRLGPNDWRQRSVVTASKFTRLSRVSGAPDSEIREVLSSTIAPFVSAYAIWLIDKARQKGHKNLLFLARDMQIVHQVAELYVRELGLDMRCTYACASRSAWHPAGYMGPGPSEPGWLTDALNAVTLPAVLSRLVPDADPSAFGEWTSFAVRQRETCTSEALLQALGSEPLRTHVEHAVSRHRQHLLQYLVQCGCQAGEPVALVDAGWRGTLQNSLARAFRSAGVRQAIDGYYIGLRHVRNVEADCSMTAFLPANIVERLGPSLVFLLESLLTANHGSTLHYARDADSDRIRPVLGEAPPEPVLKQWSLIRECCVEYASELIRTFAWPKRDEVLTRAMAEPLLVLAGEPSRRDAQLFRNWNFDSGRGAMTLRKLTGQLSAKDLAKLFRARITSQKQGDIYLSHPWVTGSIAASNLPSRILASLLMPRHLRQHKPAGETCTERASPSPAPR